MILACLFLLEVFSLGVAAADTTCDDGYVVNTVWIRRQGSASGTSDNDEVMSYAGCKKGCYYNNYTTYNEYGSLKCLKCSEIKDETVCKNNIATCQWTKKGKCASQSCLGIAKVHVNLNNTATFVEYGEGVETRVESYMNRVKLAEECISGSPKEQIFNQAYLDDIKTWVNYGGFGDATALTGCLSTINNCDSCKYPNGSVCRTTRCARNTTLDDFIGSNTLCDDKLSGSPCKLLPGTVKELCRWQAEHYVSSAYTVYDDTAHTVCRAGTAYEKCLLEDMYLHDEHPCVDSLGNPTTCPGGGNYPLLTDDDRQKLYGYRTTAEICQNELNRVLKACDFDYEIAVGNSTGWSYDGLTYITGCYSGTAFTVTPASKTHDRVQTKAQREACHQIYSCMYSKSNGRCSVWAVWAFVLALVLSIVFVVIVLAVVCVLLFRKLKGKYSKTSPVNPSQSGDDTDELLPGVISKGVASSSSSADPVGSYVLIKLGKQEKQTKKNASLAWGETVVFTDLSAEDDDVDVTLHEDDGTPVGTGSLRLNAFVNKKEHVAVAVSRGGAGTGTVELDVEVIVQDSQKPPLITATFVVCSGSKL